MINFNQPSRQKPFMEFKKKYENAINAHQKQIEAISISSYSRKFDEVNSRYVNLKIVNDQEFIFFSNYNSPKAKEFKQNNKISALVFWNSTGVQIRIKALIKKTPEKFNNEYFSKRAIEKNALAISSNQSNVIDSYEEVLERYNKSIKLDNLKECQCEDCE